MTDRHSALISRLLRYRDTHDPKVQRVRYLDREIGVVIRCEGLWHFYGNERDNGGYRYREGHGQSRSEATLTAYALVRYSKGALQPKEDHGLLSL